MHKSLADSYGPMKISIIHVIEYVKSKLIITY